MSNIAYVTSRRAIDPKLVQTVFDHLNETKFKGILTLTVEHYPNGDQWIIECPHVDGYYVHRNCWFESKRKFAISHGGSGGSFAWWVDFSFTNELALRCDGTISDDGVPERWKGEQDYMPTYAGFLRKQWEHVDPKFMPCVMQSELGVTPESFQDDVKSIAVTTQNQPSHSQQQSSSTDNPSS